MKIEIDLLYGGSQPVETKEFTTLKKAKEFYNSLLPVEKNPNSLYHYEDPDDVIQRRKIKTDMPKPE